MYLIPDSLIIMLCNPSGIKLITANNCQEYTKHKALEDPAFSGVNDITTNSKFMAFAC